VRPRQHLLSRSLGEQQRARAVHINQTLHKSHTWFPVGSSKKRPPGESRGTLRRDIDQGRKVQHDGPAKVTIRLEAGRHKGLTGLQHLSTSKEMFNGFVHIAACHLVHVSSFCSWLVFHVSAQFLDNVVTNEQHRPGLRQAGA
jgi:hypothetical protein